MNKVPIILIFILICSCKTGHRIYLPKTDYSKVQLGGSAFYKKVAALTRKDREEVAVQEILAGNMPSFLKRFVRVRSTIVIDGITHKAVFYVMPDYLSVGTDDDWARIPLTPMAATIIADSFHCFLPTRKMVDLIYEQSAIKLEPIPLETFRDSSETMWQHHLLIERQRKGKKGLIAGIKKDVVISPKVLSDKRPNRVAIYGWHKSDGKPIQPLYAGHVNWYVDYSHGIRLVYRKIHVDGKQMDYTEVLQHPIYKSLLCDEDRCDYLRYK